MNSEIAPGLLNSNRKARVSLTVSGLTVQGTGHSPWIVPGSKSLSRSLGERERERLTYADFTFFVHWLSIVRRWDVLHWRENVSKVKFFHSLTLWNMTMTANALCYAWRQCLRWTFSQTVSPKLELSALVIRRSLAVLLFFFTWHRWQILLLQFEKNQLEQPTVFCSLSCCCFQSVKLFQVSSLSGAICGQFCN